MPEIEGAKSVEFRVRRGRTLLGIVASVLVGATGAASLTINIGALNLGLALGVLGIIAAAYGLHTNLRSAAMRPWLSISPTGLRIPLFSGQTIAWSDVASLAVTDRMNSVQILVRLSNPSKYRPTRTWNERLNAALGFTHPGIPLRRHLDKPDDVLMDAVTRIAPTRLLPIQQPAYTVFDRVCDWGRRVFVAVGIIILLFFILIDPSGLGAGMIAESYRDGIFVPRDDVRAAQWHRWIAERPGLFRSKSQGRLGEQYLAGHGVPRNSIEAYQWLTRAAIDGNSRAPQLRPALLSSMSSEELQEASRRTHDGLLHDFPVTGEALWPRFLRAPGMKVAVAIKLDPDQAGFAWGRTSLDEAIADAMNRCRAFETVQQKCQLLMIGDTVVADLSPIRLGSVLAAYREAAGTPSPVDRF